MLYSCIRMATVHLKGLSLSKSDVYTFLYSFAVCVTIPATDTNQTCARFCINHLVSSALSSFVVMYKHSSGSKKLSITTITLFDNQYHIDRHVHVRHHFQFIYSVSQKKIPPRGPDIFSFFNKRLRICNRFFTHLLNVPIFARLQIFIQLSPILTKLCHIKRVYAVHIICAKCPKRAKTREFRRFRKSLIALLIVVCGKSL